MLYVITYFPSTHLLSLSVSRVSSRFPFKRNRLRCVHCVNENPCVSCVKISRKKRKRQPIGMLGRSSGNHDRLLANASACVSCGFRLRNARNASDCVWMETGFEKDMVWSVLEWKDAQMELESNWLIQVHRERWVCDDVCVLVCDV